MTVHTAGPIICRGYLVFATPLKTVFLPLELLKQVGKSFCQRYGWDVFASEYIHRPPRYVTRQNGRLQTIFRAEIDLSYRGLGINFRIGSMHPFDLLSTAGVRFEIRGRTCVKVQLFFWRDISRRPVLDLA